MYYLKCLGHSGNRLVNVRGDKRQSAPECWGLLYAVQHLKQTYTEDFTQPLGDDSVGSISAQKRV